MLMKKTPGFPFQTINERYQELAETATGQIEALQQAFDEIENPEDPSDDWSLQGITRDKDQRAMLVFASPDTPNERSIVYVDAILDLRDLLCRERILPTESEA